MLLRILLAVIFLSPLCQPAAAGERLVISTRVLPPYTAEDGSGFFGCLFRELEQRTGLAITLVHLPEIRAVDMADNGDSDGVGPRPAGFEERYAHLLRVTEPFIVSGLVAFTQKRAQVACWDDLAGKLAAFPKGWVLPSGAMPSSTRIVLVRTPHHGMAMLASGRVDAALTVRELGQHEIVKYGYAGIEYRPPVLKEVPLFLYLNKRHAALVPAVEEALRAMKEDGTWSRLHSQALERFYE